MIRNCGLLIAAASVSPGAAQTSGGNGHNKCKCLSLDAAKAGLQSGSYFGSVGSDANCAIPATDDGQQYCYAQSFGGEGCKEYENTLPPTCAQSDGTAISGRPAWCGDPWCWVDPNDCDEAYVDDALPSIMFPDSGLFYSYGTCGAEQRFAKWQYARNQTAVELKNSIEAYVKDIRDKLEQHVSLIAKDENQGACTSATELACDCSSCTEQSAWTGLDGTKQELDFKKSNTVATKARWNSGGADVMRDQCAAGLIGTSMRKVALREYNDQNRIAYMYYGSQATGMMVQWPALEWCPASWDARMRPWYATAASGPKDVVLVLDKSGSMNKAGRWDAVKTAAQKVLLTLGDEDYATIITFSTAGEIYNEEHKLHKMTPPTKERMEAWLNDENAAGETNFRAGLEKAGLAFTNALTTKQDTSKCTQILIFLTDGVDTQGFKAKDVKGIRGLEGVTFMTYSFGNDIGDQQVVKKMACQNDGIWHRIPDGGDIATTMASYYQIFAASIDAKEERWVEYDDAATGTSLMAACLSVYDRSSSVRLLNGVVCIDLNVIIDIPTFKGKDTDNTAWTAMREAATSCTPIRVSANDLNTFREMQGGVCRPCDNTDEDCPTDPGNVAAAATSSSLSSVVLLLLLAGAAAALQAS